MEPVTDQARLWEEVRALRARVQGLQASLDARCCVSLQPAQPRPYLEQPAITLW